MTQEKIAYKYGKANNKNQILFQPKIVIILAEDLENMNSYKFYTEVIK